MQGRGKIEYDNLGKYNIYLNESNDIKTKRFTVAHEIGHFVCDSAYLKEHKELFDGIEDGAYDPREVRANEFAAELLMPQEEFIDQYQKLKKDIVKLSNHFETSQQSIFFRIFSLGFLG